MGNNMDPQKNFSDGEKWRKNMKYIIQGTLLLGVLISTEYLTIARCMDNNQKELLNCIKDAQERFDNEIESMNENSDLSLSDRANGRRQAEAQRDRAIQECHNKYAKN